MSFLNAKNITFGYHDEETILKDLSLDIPSKKIISLIGPNGCGKSTLLKSLSRILSIRSGQIFLDGRSIAEMKTKDIAQKMAILSQTSENSIGLSVLELVSYGRFPYQKGMSSFSETDREKISWALEVTGLADFNDRIVDSLSGGQRQRVWIAMALAQDTELLVLDEPTTYLDLSHQLEVLQLLQKLNNVQEKTILMSIHDLNHASRFSDHMIGMKDGAIVASGTPEEVMTPENLKEIFEIDAIMAQCPFSHNPILLSYDLIK